MEKTILIVKTNSGDETSIGEAKDQLNRKIHGLLEEFIQNFVSDRL